MIGSLSASELPGLWQVAGMWIGLAVSLAIFSLILGENWLSRLAQYLLVGTGLGYAAVLAWQAVLLPRLIAPLLAGQAADWTLWIGLILGGLLWLAGVERLANGPDDDPAARSSRPRPFTRLVRGAGVAPVALLVGAALGVGIAGAWQGTLLPQITRAVAWQADGGGATLDLLTGVLVLLLTTGALLALVMDVDRYPVGPAVVRGLIKLWIWLGQRGLWLAAGVIFARLLAARFSLLIAWFYGLFIFLEKTGLWRWADRVWGSLF